MSLTNNSLATAIAWISTCFLSGGASAYFDDRARSLLSVWGCFGLIAAVGFDLSTRANGWKRKGEQRRIADRRLERGREFANGTIIARAAIRKAVAQLLGRSTAALCHNKRYLSDLTVHLDRPLSNPAVADDDKFVGGTAKIVNLSGSGFELRYNSLLPRVRVRMTVLATNGHCQILLGEILWCVARRWNIFRRRSFPRRPTICYMRDMSLLLRQCRATMGRAMTLCQ